MKRVVVAICVLVFGMVVIISIAALIFSNASTEMKFDELQREAIIRATEADAWFVYVDCFEDLAFFFSHTHDFSEENIRNMLRNVLYANNTYHEVYIGFTDDTAIMGSGFPIEEYYDWWRATERSWFRAALVDTDRTNFTSMYIDAATGDLFITASRAVMRDGLLLGVIGIDIIVSPLQDIVFGATLNGEGFSFLLDSNGDVLIHPDVRLAPNRDGLFENLDTARNGAYSGLWRQISASDGLHSFISPENVQMYCYSVRLSEIDLILVSVLPGSIVSQPVTSVLLLIIPIALVILIISTVLICVFSIRRPPR